MLSLLLAGCATTTPKSVTTKSITTEAQVPTAAAPAAGQAVQAVSLPASGTDGQTSWLIEPGIQRVPTIAGLDPKLPAHIERRLGYAFDLAQRGATYSATGEFQSVLGLCALELDTRDGGTSHRDALRQGLLAIDEADDFSGEQVDWRRSADLRTIAAGHTTPVLQQNASSAIDSIQAMQAYYAFAEERLAYACGELPGSSLAFYGLGRTLVVPDTGVAHAAGKAVLYHRVALAVAPQNVLAGNELGVLLAQHGRLDEAEKVFQQCVALNGGPETQQNLLAVYARKADQKSGQAVVTAGQSPAAPSAGPAASNMAGVRMAAFANPAPQPVVAETPASSKSRFSLRPKFPLVFGN
jgi:hypothetical protein